MLDFVTILAVAASEGPPPGQNSAPGGGLFDNPIMLVMILVLGMFMFLPMLGQKKEKRRRARMTELKKHDRVVTTGGIFGSIATLDENNVTLEVGKDMRIKMKRSSIFDLENGAELDKQAAASKGKKKAIPAKAKG